MSKTTFEHSTATLEEKLTAYWELVDEREQMLARIAKANSEKDSVTERIFQKVIADYEATLEDIAARLAPLKGEIDAQRQQADQDIEQLNTAIAEIEDELAETEFRHRVGEYDSARLSELKSRVQPKLTQARELRSELMAHIQAMDRRRPAQATKSTPATQPAPPITARDAKPAPSAPTATTRETTVRPSSHVTLEDPHQWARELEPDKNDSVKNKSVEMEFDDPLAALTDPTLESHHQATAGSHEEAAARPSNRPRSVTAAPAYPNLLIRSGAHAGKMVPLLPMTMSIGREHDNNIELKDPEVARYHARIVYENGRFFVEDLDSSTGTWINGQHQKKQALSEGDVIRIGTTELAIEFA